MRHATLLDVLETRRHAAETAHAGIEEHFGGVGIFLHDFDDVHVFRDFHWRRLRSYLRRLSLAMSAR